MRDFTLYTKNTQYSHPSQYIMVQSTPAAAGAEDESPNSLMSRAAAAHQDVSFLKNQRALNERKRQKGKESKEREDNATQISFKRKVFLVSQCEQQQVPHPHLIPL